MYIFTNFYFSSLHKNSYIFLCLIYTQSPFSSLLFKSLPTVPLSKFNFDISESDIVKLNLTYENGKISEVSVILKDDNEKQIRQKLIQDKFQSLRKKS